MAVGAGGARGAASNVSSNVLAKAFELVSGAGGSDEIKKLLKDAQAERAAAEEAQKAANLMLADVAKREKAMAAEHAEVFKEMADRRTKLGQLEASLRDMEGNLRAQGVNIGQRETAMRKASDEALKQAADREAAVVKREEQVTRWAAELEKREAAVANREAVADDNLKALNAIKSALVNGVERLG